MVSSIIIFWRWYYGEAIKDILTAWKNFIIFSLEYFSIPLLLRTLLSPWRRDITKKPRGFDIQKFFTSVAFNTISRGIGLIIRVLTIIIGIVVFFATVIFGALFFIIWLILPFALVGFFLLALVLIF